MHVRPPNARTTTTTTTAGLSSASPGLAWFGLASSSQQQHCRCQIATKHLQRPPAFANIGDPGADEAGGPSLLTSPEDSFVSESAPDDRELTVEEERGVERLLASERVADAEAYTAGVRLALDRLEAQNIHALLACRAQVDGVMARLDAAILALDAVDGTLAEYDALLQPVRRDAARVAEQEALVRVQGRNSATLVDNLRALVTFADLPKRMMEALQTADLSRPEDVQLCSQAVNMACSKSATAVDPGWSGMAAVRASTSRLVTVLDACATRLAKTFPGILERQVGGRWAPLLAACSPSPA